MHVNVNSYVVIAVDQVLLSERKVDVDHSSLARHMRAGLDDVLKWNDSRCIEAWEVLGTVSWERNVRQTDLATRKVENQIAAWRAMKCVVGFESSCLRQVRNCRLRLLHIAKAQPNESADDCNNDSAEKYGQGLNG